MARGRLREIRPAEQWTSASLLSCALGVDHDDVMASQHLQPSLPLAQRGGDLLRTVLGPFLALVFVVGVFTIADNLQTDGGRFATLQNAQNVLVQSATVAVAALGMTMIIISAGIDLSAGTTMALCATVLAWFLRESYSPAVSVAAAAGHRLPGRFLSTAR